MWKVWFFNGYIRGSGRVFMMTVENKTAEILLIIKKWVEKRSTFLIIERLIVVSNNTTIVV